MCCTLSYTIQVWHQSAPFTIKTAGTKTTICILDWLECVFLLLLLLLCYFTYLTSGADRIHIFAVKCTSPVPSTWSQIMKLKHYINISLHTEYRLVAILIWRQRTKDSSVRDRVVGIFVEDRPHLYPGGNLNLIFQSHVKWQIKSRILTPLIWIILRHLIRFILGHLLLLLPLTSWFFYHLPIWLFFPQPGITQSDLPIDTD